MVAHTYISALEPEDCKPEASLGYMASPYFKKEKEETRGRQGEERGGKEKGKMELRTS